MFLWLVRGQLDGQDIVGGVACGGQGPSASAGFVNRTNIDVFMLKRGHLSRFELDDGQRVKEDLGERLANDHVLPVPACTLHEKAFNVGSVLWLLIHVGLLCGYLKHNPEHEYLTQ